MLEKIDSFTCADGLTCKAFLWGEESDVVVAMHHGLGEHAGRIKTIASALSDLGVRFAAFDARGHGQSDGTRGHANGLDQLADDFQCFLEWLKANNPTKKIIVYGHSMGAASVLTYFTQRDIDPLIAGLILSAPPVSVDLGLKQKVMLLGARLLVRFFPAFAVASDLDAAGISSSAEERERYLADPLVHGKVSPRLAISLIDDVDKLLDSADRIRVPVFLYHGVDDTIASVKGARALKDCLDRNPDVTFCEWENMRHEVHYEVPEGRDALFQMWREWLGHFLT